MFRKYVSALSIAAMLLIGSSVASAEESITASDSSLQDTIIRPNAFSESVLHTTRQRQEKIGIFAWENKGGLEYNYRTITFNKTYSLTGTSTSYTPTETIGIGMYSRYEVTTYNYIYN